MKKHIISTIVGSLLIGATASHASDFQFRIYHKAQLSNWSEINPIEHPWVNTGSHYDCSDWSPFASTIAFGEDFLQSRDCKQNQERDIEIRQLDSFSGTVKTVRNKKENRSISETESQSAIGTYQNWVSFDSVFTDWIDKYAAHSPTAWLPEPSTQTANFTQSRNYKQPQERYEQQREIATVTGEIRTTGEPILRAQDDDRSENRSVVVGWSEWTNEGIGYNCSAWSPLSDSVSRGQEFTQTRNCSQNQARNRNYTANSLLISSKKETKTIIASQTQVAIGTSLMWGQSVETYSGTTTCGMYVGNALDQLEDAGYGYGTGMPQTGSCSNKGETYMYGTFEHYPEWTLCYTYGFTQTCG